MEMKMLQSISTQDLPVFACPSLDQVQLGEVLPIFLSFKRLSAFLVPAFYEEV